MNTEAGNNPKNKRTLGYVGLSALLLAVVACTCGPLSNLDQISSALEATPTLMTLDGGSTGGGSDGGGDSFNFVEPDQSGLKSYHTTFTMTYTGTKEDGTSADGNFTMEQFHTSDPLANSVSWSGQGNALTAGSDGSFTMIQIGDSTYMITKDQDGQEKCIALISAGSGASDSPAYSPDTFFAGGDMSNAHRVLPDEVVNGVLSQHWQFTNVDAALAAASWTNYTVDAWTAVDGGYAVKSVFKGDGNSISGVGGTGHTEWEFNLLEANTDITIDPPQGCGGSEDIPRMADAADSISLPGTIAYTSPSAIDDVIAFYQSEMPAAGWTAGETTTAESATIMTFTKDGRTATVTISEADGQTQVMIQEE